MRLECAFHELGNSAGAVQGKLAEAARRPSDAPSVGNDEMRHRPA